MKPTMTDFAEAEQLEQQLSLEFTDFVEWEHGFIPTYGGSPIKARRDVARRVIETYNESCHHGWQPVVYTKAFCRFNKLEYENRPWWK